MEFPSLGERCAHEGCAQLDFLPLECVHCHLTFCKEHHQPASHACTCYADNVVTTEDLKEHPREKWQYKCSHPACQIKELVPINCIKCKRHFCLNHRHFDQHECIKEREGKGKQVSAELQAGKDLQEKIKDEVNAKLEEAKGAGGHKAAMAHKLALMKLKARAKGDNAIPRTERVFFSVDCFNRQQNPVPLDVFLGNTWSMGKVIDFLAKTGSIKNKNHLPGNPVLHVFKGETCLSKPFDVTLKSLMEQGVLNDGDSLSLQLIDN